MSERQALHVETVDTPSWHAVLIVEERPNTEPRILCVGFNRARQRDEWFGFYTASVRALADAFPVAGVR